MKHIAIATGTRADWGLLSPLARRLRQDADVTVMATNMHLLPEFGMTVNEIVVDGFTPLWLPTEGTPPQITAKTIEQFAEAFATMTPDAVVILGDRFEMLGVATAALLQGVPIVHIAGGTVSEGAFDDSIRHAITKMATLHFPETDDYRRNILQMGENPEHVIATGAIGISDINDFEAIPAEELAADLGIDFDKPTYVVTLHAATLDSIPPLQQMQNLLDALEDEEDINLIFTYPNNDVDPRPQIALMEDFCRRHADRAVIVPSLGKRRYMSALRYAAGVIGNSSSGIVEVASFGIPTLDIGCRQTGRAHGESVIHCDSDTISIKQGLEKIKSGEVRAIAARKDNPYYRPDTVECMAGVILTFPFAPFPHKPFFPHHE